MKAKAWKMMFPFKVDMSSVFFSDGQDASATKHNFHLEAYSALVDLPATTPLLQKIFGSRDYFAAGCGGDVVLAGAIATELNKWFLVLVHTCVQKVC